MGKTNEEIYIGYILFVFRISQVFRETQHEIRNISLYTFRISSEFRVLLMLRKNKPQNPLTFHANANCGAKC